MTSMHHTYREGRTCSLPTRVPAQGPTRASLGSQTQSEQSRTEQNRGQPAQTRKCAATIRTGQSILLLPGQGNMCCQGHLDLPCLQQQGLTTRWRITLSTPRAE